MLKARKKVAIFSSSNPHLCVSPSSEREPYCAFSMEPSHDPVAIGASFAAAQVGATSIPLELVDAENAQGGGAAGERGRQNVSATAAADESMEMDTSGGGVGSQTGSGGEMGGKAGMAATGAGGGGIGTPSDQLSLAGGMEVSVGGKSRAPHVRDAAAQSAIDQFQQQVARSLGTAASQHGGGGGGGGLEVAPESIVFPTQQQPPAAVGHGAAATGGRVTADTAGPELMSAAKRLLGGVNVSYGDLDISGMNSSVDQSLDVSSLSTPKSARGNVSGATGSMLNEPGSPSSVNSDFDSSELLNAEELQHDEMTSRLSRAGPIGLATAAAIMTGRKRKRQHIFESNPALRKRHCSKLVRKLKETIVELTARVGLQAAVVFYRPGKPDPKEEPSYKVFGASPLDSCLVNQKPQICSEMEAVLNQQAPLATKEPDLQAANGDLHELPPVMFDGIPTPVHKMTQAQLRAFIPNMLKYSTGRGKPGWGKDEMKPVWWPDDIPWQNVRSDMRTAEKKKEVPWTEGLRRIVISCYLHHGRLDLLPEFSLEHLPPISQEAAQQIQMQLERLQQTQGGGGAGGGASVSAGTSVVGVGGGGSGEEGGGGVMESASGAQLSDTGGGEVFTVDTGIGNCDNSGMPTLADATLAEAAAKLQQVADETGEVQYATHLVTVTEKDSKALGQPVGSTTTVLLTAYPGGHSGGVESGTESSEQLIAPPTTSATVPNVQVVYSASHIDNIPDNLVSSAASGSTTTTTAPLTQSTAAPMSIPAVVDPAGMGVATTNEGGGASSRGVIPSSILGQNEVVSQIQGAMAEIQGQLMGGAAVAAAAAAAMETAVLGSEGTQQGSGHVTGQASASSGIQDSIIGQGGVVGGDSIQDSIQDSIMGQGVGGAGGGASVAAILGGEVVEGTGMQDSSQYLNPASGNILPGGGVGGGANVAGDEGPTSVSDIASQLINQYVASTRSVPVPFQAPPTNTGTEQPPVESMQTDVVPQSSDTTIPPSVST